MVLRSISLLLGVLLAGAAPALAQPQTARIEGTVVDRSGGALPGVVVTVHSGEELVTTIITDASGSFEVDGLAPGAYRLTAELSGFQPASVELLAAAAEPVSTSLVLTVARYTEQLTVTATRDERPLASVPGAVGVVTEEVLANTRGINLGEVLQQLPGVYAGNVSGVDDLRITIRGAGVRSGFGSRGVLLMVDGVPLTEPDGQTPHIDGQVDLSSAERVEVVKGPASAVYGGAALGGVVNVISRAPSRQFAGQVRGEAGAYRFGKLHGAASGAAGPLLLRGTAGFTTLDGFREHNSLENWTTGVDAVWPVSAADRFTFKFYATDALLELPGTLSREQFEQDPTQVRPVHVTNDYGRDNRVIRFGGRYERTFGTSHLVELDSYGQTRSLLHPIFVVIDQDARRYMGHARYRYAGRNHALTTGLDVDRQAVDDAWFVNVGGGAGPQIRDDENLITNMGLYVQEEVQLTPQLSVTAGLRYDRVEYDLTDRLLRDGDASDLRVFERVSPKLGIVGSLTPAFTLYGNVSTGFETPTLGEVRQPAGFNEQVEPQRAVSIEGGTRGEAGRLSYDVSLYHMRVDDEILPQTIDNVTVYRNVARAGHTGLEAAATLFARRGAQIEATYAWSRFVLEDFGPFSGNRLPGIPAHTGSVGVRLGPARGWDASAQLTWAGKTYLDDANAETADAYAVLTAGAGYQIGSVRTFVRIDNLTDTLYTNRVQVNDSGGFFFYPAPGRNGSVGVQVRW